MIPADVAVYIATEQVDMRISFDILAGLVRDRLGGDPRTGALFVFLGRRGDRVKVLFYDRSGYCILYKRLCRGTFRLPAVIAPGAASVQVDEAELELFLEGLELPVTPASQRKRGRRMH